MIPAPPANGFDIGSVHIYFYSLCILAGILVAYVWGRRRFLVRGGSDDHFDTTILVAVLVGIVGARVYHVITDAHLYFGPDRDWLQVFNIRGGGLGIWGGIIFGGVAVAVMCRRFRIDFGSFADVLAPMIPFAQAIGRLGNWFNQELFGAPTNGWGLFVEPAYRPPQYADHQTFHPTFAYEMIWCTLGGIVLLAVEKRFRLGRGKLFTLYVIWYTFGRFFIEALRIDPATTIGDFRINNYVSLIIFVAAVIIFVWQLKSKPGYRLWPFGFAKPAGGLASVATTDDVSVSSSSDLSVDDTQGIDSGSPSA